MEEKQARDKILEMLGKVLDPEFGVDIVNLGLVYGIEYDKENNIARVKLTMTTPTCPYAGQILMDVQDKLSKIEEIDEIHVELVWDPPWSTDMMSEEAKAMLGVG